MRSEGGQQVRMGIGAGLGLSLSPGFVKSTWKSSLAVGQTGEGTGTGIWDGDGAQEHSQGRDRDLGWSWGTGSLPRAGIWDLGCA